MPAGAVTNAPYRRPLPRMVTPPGQGPLRRQPPLQGPPGQQRVQQPLQGQQRAQPSAHGPRGARRQTQGPPPGGYRPYRPSVVDELHLPTVPEKDSPETLGKDGVSNKRESVPHIVVTEHTEEEEPPMDVSELEDVPVSEEDKRRLEQPSNDLTASKRLSWILRWPERIQATVDAPSEDTVENGVDPAPGATRSSVRVSGASARRASEGGEGKRLSYLLRWPERLKMRRFSEIDKAPSRESLAAVTELDVVANNAAGQEREMDELIRELRKEQEPGSDRLSAKEQEPGQVPGVRTQQDVVGGQEASRDQKHDEEQQPTKVSKLSKEESLDKLSETQEQKWDGEQSKTQGLASDEGIASG